MDDERRIALEERLSALHVEYRVVHKEYAALQVSLSDENQDADWCIVADRSSNLWILRDNLERKLFDLETEIFRIWGELIPGDDRRHHN